VAVCLLSVCCWALPWEHTVAVDVLIFVALLLTAPLHCQHAGPGELAAYVEAAGQVKSWIFALSPMSAMAMVNSAVPPAPQDGRHACAVLQVWLPAVLGLLVPTAVLAATQRTWRAAFLARRAAQDQVGRAPPEDQWPAMPPFHVGALLLAVSAVLWSLVEVGTSGQAWRSRVDTNKYML
jgi:hypothetical protein